MMVAKADGPFEGDICAPLEAEWSLAAGAKRYFPIGDHQGDDAEGVAGGCGRARSGGASS
jgi:hypothetical protein